MIVLATSEPGVLARWQQAAPADAAVVHDRAGLDALLTGQQPDLVLLDLQLDGLGGAPGAEALIGQHRGTRMVVMSREPSEDEGIAALRAGARGYCNVYIDPRLLEKVITTVLAGEVWAGRKLVDRLVQMIASSRPAPAGDDSGGLDALTPREREIALLVGKGVSNKAIAQRLDITERTVKAHLGAVFSKLGVTGRLQLALRVAARPDTAGH
jgi:DNA-binding NarL/FixJ family response regulator